MSELQPLARPDDTWMRLRPGQLRPGEELWTDNPHRLSVRLRREIGAGRVREVIRWRSGVGLHSVIVVRLKPGPTRRRIVALWATGAGVAGSAMAVATWWVATHLAEIAIFLLALLGAAGALTLLARVLGGHRAGCVGLHCPGCRH